VISPLWISAALAILVLLLCAIIAIFVE
jgi:hypothetical protein